LSTGTEPRDLVKRVYVYTNDRAKDVVKLRLSAKVTAK